MRDELILGTKELRIKLSKVLVMISLLEKNREISLSFTRGQEAFMFLGKILEFLGINDPYDIDPGKRIIIEGMHHERVKDIIRELQGIISCSTWNYLFDFIIVPGQPFIKYTSDGWNVINLAFGNLLSSKMWLDMELNRFVNKETTEAE